MDKAEIIKAWQADANAQQMHIDNSSDGRINYAAHYTYHGHDYMITTSFDAAEHKRIMDAYAADEGMLDWDDAEYDVTEL